MTGIDKCTYACVLQCSKCWSKCFQFEMSARYTLVTHETLFNAYLVSHFLYPGPFHCLDLNGKYIHQTAIKVTPMSAALFISVWIGKIHTLKCIGFNSIQIYMNCCLVWTRKVKLIYEKWERYAQFFKLSLMCFQRSLTFRDGELTFKYLITKIQTLRTQLCNVQVIDLIMPL